MRVSNGRAAERAVPLVAAAIAVAITVAGLVVHLTTRITLGTPLPPFNFTYSPALRWPTLIGLALGVVVVAGFPVAIARLRPPFAFAGFAYLATLAVGLAVNAARRGTRGWDHVFVLKPRGSLEASHEYLPALPDLHRGVAWYVRHFPDLLPGLPTHVKGNPPGPLVAMHLLRITTPGRLTAACVAVGALCAPLAYAIGRTLEGERRGRVAAALTCCSPSVILLGVTSVDYAFAAMGALVAWLLIARPVGARLAGCLAAGAAAFFSWVLLAIPVWAVLVQWRRDGPRSAAVLAGGALAGVVVVTLALAAVWGYDPVRTLHTIRGIYAGGAAAHRPYAFWVFGSPAAWLAVLGAPVAWGLLREAGRGEPAALALAAIVLVSTLGGFTKAETERIWLPYVPLAAVATAATGFGSAGRLRWALAVMVLEAIAIEILFGTVW